MDQKQNYTTGSTHTYNKTLKNYRKHHDKKEVDLTKPLTAGAFVDAEKIKELHVTLNKQLPPEPPMRWLLAEKEKLENVRNFLLQSLYY